MTLLQPGDELLASTCGWCGKGVSDDDLIETLDGTEICPDCEAHYDSNADDDGPYPLLERNLDDR